ncbi:MAG: fibrobacter succinogenes major paralogous domain-containing protein, partial [Candidatus Symbiothrix sp.]|nr:fibrobacter succinogenes major paralogous domain-containing protein [Candidatus Symbiothrix sp.]
TQDVPTVAVDTLGTKLPVVALPDTAHLNLGDALIYNLDVDETATGMVVYNISDDPCGRGLIPCLYVWDGATWRPAGCPFPDCTSTCLDTDTTINAAIRSGETYTDNGFNESTAGTYQRTISNAAGCDSTITLNLAVQPEWGTNPWIGAFWRDDETGERIIAAGNASSWKVDVDDPTGTGAWLKLALGAGNDPDLWSDDPDNAENYQVPGDAKSIPLQPAGNVLFRIGATGVNPQTDGTYETGKRPRYATITLTVGGTEYKLFCRQGESADYLFSPTDTYTNPSGIVTARPAAVKFSPYNLTGANLNDDDNLAYAVGVRGGTFVDYPTKAGAFFQWANVTNPTYAYHPTKPTGSIAGWYDNYPITTQWDTHKATNETCPPGWVRPNDGTSPHSGNYSDFAGSQIRESLFADAKAFAEAYLPYKDIYWGYYADGYFDRRTITTSANSVNNSAVSPSTKDVAYCGLLFTNPGTGTSLFMPGGGYRNSGLFGNGGMLLGSGSDGSYWSTPNYYADSSRAWGLYVGFSTSFNMSLANPGVGEKSFGNSVRCVKE